jgi:hypothetical protein
MEDSDADVRYYASRAKEKTTQGGAEPMNRKSGVLDLNFANVLLDSLIKEP